MQDLFKSLQDRDIGHLKVIAEIWGLELPTGTSLETAKFLADSLSSPEFIAELNDSLPIKTKDLLHYLLENEGRGLLPDLVRRFGEIREMGPGRRDRFKPWRDPVSPVEDLWYRGLCGRAFVDTPGGAQEILFIPNELVDALTTPRKMKEIQTLGHPTSDPSQIVRANDSAVSDITTLLAYLRNSPPQSLGDWVQPPRVVTQYLQQPDSAPLLIPLLVEMGIIDRSTLQPLPTETKPHLELSQVESLKKLFEAWSKSILWNDLANLPHLTAPSDEWPNNPVIARTSVLGFLHVIPIGEWWDLGAFINDVRASSPSFQRPAGDFDAWYLTNSPAGEFLRGFQHWDQVEGALIRFMISGPLHWFGLIDLGKPQERDWISAFRLTPLASIFLHGEEIPFVDDEESKISLLPDGVIRASPSSNRTHRYQIARFTDWISFAKDLFTYRITPKSLSRASDQGLGIEHIQSLLINACENVPPSILKALNRWETKGSEAQIETTSLLRVQEPKTLDTLLANPRSAKCIIERISPTSAIIHAKGQNELYKVAVQNGMFIDLDQEA